MFCRPIALLLLVLPLTALGAEEPISYARQIKPILDKHCIECHSGWFPKGQLRLDSLAHIREGGKSGAVVLPGKPDKGWLINLVTPRGGRPSTMPPGPVRLNDEQLSLIRQWIRQGAQ